MSLIQPVDQEILRTLRLIKHSILWKGLPMVWKRRQNIMKAWKDHTIEGIAVVTVKTVKAMEPETMNSC